MTTTGVIGAHEVRVRSKVIVRIGVLICGCQLLEHLLEVALILVLTLSCLLKHRLHLGVSPLLWHGHHSGQVEHRGHRGIGVPGTTSAELGGS